MASSFTKSLQNASATSVTSLAKSSVEQVSTFAIEEPESAYVVSTKYDWYANYKDNAFSVIDTDKNIIMDKSQINLTQEENSQFIPFKLPRYWDGIDLMEMSFRFRYVNSKGEEDIVPPKNVSYNDTHIIIHWLVGANATYLAGEVDFEIFATGVNEKGENYTWRTRPNGKLNILKSLVGNGVVQPTDAWIMQFIREVDAKIAEAQSYSQAAQASADEAKATAAEVDEKIANVESSLSESLDSKITAELENYYTKPEIDEFLANIDFTEIEEKIDSIDGLANFDVNYDETAQTLTFMNGESEIKTIPLNMTPSMEWITANDLKVDNKISAAVGTVQTGLNDYKNSTDADLLSIHENIDNLPTTLETDYYNKPSIDGLLANKADSSTVSALSTRVDKVESTANTNSANIVTVTDKLAEIEEKMLEFNTDPSLSYYATYDATTGQYTLWEVEGDEESVKSQFTISGGTGGSSTATTVTIERITASPLVVTNNDSAIIEYTFTSLDSSGDDTGEGNATWKVGNTVVATSMALQGNNTFDLTKYVSVGTQKVTLTIVDAAGTLAVKNWTIQVVDVRLESSFNDQYTYPIGDLAFTYTPYGSVEKTIHFVLDGKELDSVITSVSGIPMSYTLPSQAHGAHLLETYITAEINGSTIETDHIYKDIIWYDSTSTVPVIGCIYQDITAKQYDNVNIVYTVYDPSTESPEVVLAIDDEAVSTLVLDTTIQVWQFKSAEVGVHTLTITCGETVKTIKVQIEKLDITVTPITANLAFDFNPMGRSNNDQNRLWSDGDVSMSVSDNFDWINGGYQIDEDGDQYFCIKGGTSAVIDYQLFADDAKKNGKEFKLIFKTTNVAKPDAVFLTCMDNTTDSNHIGIQMSAHEALICGQAGKLDIPYSEEDIIEFEFNISKNTEAIPMVMGYEDGVGTRSMVYDDSYNFTQNTPKTIILGSDDCDLHIYRFKVYSSSVSDSGVLNNFIADGRNAEKIIDRHKRNQIYDENQNLNPDLLAERCPGLRVYKLSAPYFTNNKSDKVPGTTIQQLYKNGDPILDNWTCYNAQHSGQGTSSNNYGGAGRNLDFIMNNSGIEGVDPYFILGDNSRATEITLTRTSVPVAYLNAKVNIASANHLTNAKLAKKYNDNNPYKRPFVREEGVDTSFIKDTMEFYNCVIFIQETNEDISTHREFADTNWHFYALGNIGDSKKTDKTRLTDMNDKYECCVEIMDVELPLSDFPVDTMYNAMGYTVDEKTEERIYTWAKNENLGILYEKVDGEYVLTQDTEIDLTKTYYVDILEHDDFSEDFTYGWRYIYDDGSDEENARVANICKRAWIEFYRFVTTSSDEEFKANFENYMVLDSALYNYLFTTRYCMTDNRAKNTFWHFGKTGKYHAVVKPVAELLPIYCELSNGVYTPTTDTELDTSKTYYSQYAFDLSWGYDMDTSLGLNNYGKQVYRYGLEDIDVDEKGEEVFREMDSTFFCRIRDLFPSKLKSLYSTLESKNAWHAESFINEADEWQNEFPEELWRLDINRKYIRTYTSTFINGKGDSQFLVNMANGRMKYHRRQWERSQEKYMASKYQSSVASGDNAVFRCSVPSGDLVVQPNYRLKLTPYAYMYLNVKYGTQNPIQLRAEPNKVYEIPFDGEKADIVDVYSASLIQDFGDLSTCYVATADTTKASKVKKLIFGNETEGYDNPNFTTLTTGANHLLEILDITNVSGLTQSLNLSALNNLKELYAHGSNIGGVTFADGGKIEIVELPAINAISMKNLLYLTTLDVADFSKLTTLTVENCNTVDLISIFNAAPNINRVRIGGINWNLNDTNLLERIYKLKGIDKNGYNTDQSVLSGNVYVPVIRQQQLYNYQKAWPDLVLDYDTKIDQYAVTFKNDDDSILDVQYVDKGGSAVDPITREDSPISTPTKESTISTDFTFAGWDKTFNSIFDNLEVIATYSESVRSYTITYKSKGEIVQKSTGLYGENVPYTGDIPTYTLEESAYAYYLFTGWDKSGIIDGEKVVNAVFDSCTYTAGYFDGKEIGDLRPVELYALTKLGVSYADVSEKDSIQLTFGHDYDFTDVESQVVIDSKTLFDGAKCVDTGIKLFEEDRDFVIAIDYKFLAGCSNNSVLAQCIQNDGSNGFKLWYNTKGRITWGTASSDLTPIGNREMIVLRHLKGDYNLYVYNSNLDNFEPQVFELSKARSSINDSTLVFGCGKQDDGALENYATGEIHWCKIWYADLGDEACKNLAMWTHENIRFEVSGFKRYYLSNVSSTRNSISFLAAHLMDKKRAYGTASSNSGGWAESQLNKFLNTRLVKAIPVQWKSLIKQVKVASSIGGTSTEISSSDCYFSIPALIEVYPDSSTNVEPYINEGSAISYMTTNEARIRSFDGGDANTYSTRSPNPSYAGYIMTITETGGTYGFYSPTRADGVLLQFNI